jgi:hypothetical protein
MNSLELVNRGDVDDSEVRRTISQRREKVRATGKEDAAILSEGVNGFGKCPGA